jgi:hypothetical protein
MNVYGHVFDSLHETMTEQLDALHRAAAQAPRAGAAEVHDIAAGATRS